MKNDKAQLSIRNRQYFYRLSFSRAAYKTISWAFSSQSVNFRLFIEQKIVVSL